MRTIENGWLVLAAVLVACGSNMTVDGGRPGDDSAVATDAGAVDGGGPGTDGGALDAGTLDASASDGGGGSADGGVVACGSDTAPSGRRLPPSCEEARCHGTDACAMAMLEAWDFTGYSACGSATTFDPASSTAVCMTPPRFGYTFPPMCGRLSYEGNVRLFCAGDSMQVVAYFWGSFRESLGGPLSVYHAGHEYETGSGGGSGLVSFGELSDDFTRIDLEGIEEGTSGNTLRVWFLAQDAIDPSITNTTGGFEVSLTP